MLTQPNAGFTQGDHVVYPTHGVGTIIGFESQSISGMTISLVVVEFERDRMTLRVPLTKATASGLRRLSTKEDMSAALGKLSKPTKIRKTMWSRRAQEYELKINSGNPATIAEVVRELYKDDDADRSYSERQMYQAALKRLAREFAAVEKIDESKAAEKLEAIMRDVA